MVSFSPNSQVTNPVNKQNLWKKPRNGDGIDHKKICENLKTGGKAINGRETLYWSVEV